MRPEKNEPADNLEGDDANDPFLERYLPGVSEGILQLRRRILRINSSQNLSLANVILIRGESGAGKNYIAQIIASHRRWLQIRNTIEDPGLDARLDAYTDSYGEIHLPALPDNLIESELFGYKKGAFTEAKEDRPGLLGGENARREYSDILLDEIGDASALLQAKLLAVIDHGTFMPVGGRPGDEYTTSARLLLATNRNLETRVREGMFREDLFWRINPFVIHIPPLRSQPENIKGIARHIEGEITARRGAEFIAAPRPPEPRLSDEDIRWAERYGWPGNVRQLRHAITRFVFEDGEHSLEEIVLEHAGYGNSGERESVIERMVQERLERALSNEAQPLGTLKNLVGEFEREVKAGAVKWYRSARPDEEKLRRLFPDMTVESLRSKLSQWGRT